MLDSDGLPATIALLGELDGDLEFFDGLFNDLPCEENLEENDATDIDGATTAEQASSTTFVTYATSGDRRRRRWLAIAGHEDPCGWKKIAKTLKHARQATEDENARLRRMVVAHQRTVTKLVKLMQRSAALSSLPIVAQPFGEGVERFRGPPADRVQITRSLDALARRAERALPPFSTVVALSPQLQICGLENHIVHTETGDAFESTLDVAWVLPFSVDAITSAVVAHSIHLVTRKQVPNLTMVYQSPEFTIVQAVTAPKEKNGQRITKHGQIATRRERARPDGSQLVLMDKKGGIYVDATLVATIEADSCILARSVPTHDSAAPLTQIHWRRRFRIQPTSCATPTPADRAQWIHALTTKKARKIERHVDKLAQAIENVLVLPSSRSK